MQNIPHSSSSKSEIIVSIIEEIVNTSAIRMFGHIFQLPAPLEMFGKHIERQCAELLKFQLMRELHANNKGQEDTQLLLLQSSLEAILSKAFSPSSAFWEKYYERMNRRTVGTPNLLTDENISQQQIHHLARNQYPHFFITLDALYYSHPSKTEAYELIQMAMQYYLTALLLCIHSRTDDVQQSMSKALKILGPLDSPVFRKIIVSHIGAA
jgi:hypothetical protein